MNKFLPVCGATCLARGVKDGVVSTWQCYLHSLAEIGARGNARISTVFGPRAKTQSTGNWNQAVRTLAIRGALFTTATSNRIVLHFARIDRRYVIVWPQLRRSASRAAIAAAVDLVPAELVPELAFASTKMPPRFHERGGGNDDRDYVDYSAREGCRSRISEFGRQVTVNFKADADFDERGRGPCHDRFLAFGSTGYRLSYVPRPRGASPRQWSNKAGR